MLSLAFEIKATNIMWHVCCYFLIVIIFDLLTVTDDSLKLVYSGLQSVSCDKDNRCLLENCFQSSYLSWLVIYAYSKFPFQINSFCFNSVVDSVKLRLLLRTFELFSDYGFKEMTDDILCPNIWRPKQNKSLPT